MTWVFPLICDGLTPMASRGHVALCLAYRAAPASPLQPPLCQPAPTATLPRISLAFFLSLAFIAADQSLKTCSGTTRTGDWHEGVVHAAELGALAVEHAFLSALNQVERDHVREPRRSSSRTTGSVQLWMTSFDVTSTCTTLLTRHDDLVVDRQTGAAPGCPSD